MRKVWLVADAVVTPLGDTSEKNFAQVVAGESAIVKQDFGKMNVCVSHIRELQAIKETRFETLAGASLRELKNKINLPTARTLFVLSTTKGNVELLERGDVNQTIHLHESASRLARQAGLEKSIVISNACTSGVVAILAAKRFIDNNVVDHAIIVGADALSRFVISGFQSLNALSVTPCRPFDAERAGISLGEGAGAMLLSANPESFNTEKKIRILGGGTSNDANHISGPSKTGEELATAIRQAMNLSGVDANQIDFISAHGTATLYNDEMEAKAFHLAGLADTPVHSLKGNFGHTLGAAGIIETVMAAHSLENGELIPSFGFEKMGVTHPVNVIRRRERKRMKYALKTASGFGGCNAALILSLEK